MSPPSSAFTEIHHFNASGHGAKFPFVLTVYYSKMAVKLDRLAPIKPIAFESSYGYLRIMRRGIAVLPSQLMMLMHDIPAEFHDHLIEGCRVLQDGPEIVTSGCILIMDSAGRKSSVDMREPIGANLFAFLSESASGGFALLVGDSRPQMFTNFSGDSFIPVRRSRNDLFCEHLPY